LSGEDQGSGRNCEVFWTSEKILFTTPNSNLFSVNIELISKISKDADFHKYTIYGKMFRLILTFSQSQEEMAESFFRFIFSSSVCCFSE
jgi:hypothetical protein